MSNDEQDAAILRLVKDRGEAKKQKALLELELRAAGTSLYSIGTELRSVGFNTQFKEAPEQYFNEWRVLQKYAAYNE